MGLNISKGNMYDWVTHTWNTIKGKCPHGCTYCYMSRWGEQKPIRFHDAELGTNLGKDNFIFVGSGCDMWAKDIHKEWIIRTLEHCHKFDNTYLFQTKNPARVEEMIIYLPQKSKVCTTIETNKWIRPVMDDCPLPWDRATWLNEVAHHKIETYVTIEPIMEFDLDIMAHYIETCLPTQVNIGADSGKNNLPEPKRDEVLELIKVLEGFTTVKIKKNLERIIGKEWRGKS